MNECSPGDNKVGSIKPDEASIIAAFDSTVSPNQLEPIVGDPKSSNSGMLIQMSTSSPAYAGIGGETDTINVSELKHPVSSLVNVYTISNSPFPETIGSNSPPSVIAFTASPKPVNTPMPPSLFNGKLPISCSLIG